MAMDGRSWMGTDGHDRQVGLTSAQNQCQRGHVIRVPRVKYLWDSGFLRDFDPRPLFPGSRARLLWVALGILAVLLWAHRILGCCLWFRIAQQEQADKNAMQDKNCTYLLQTNKPRPWSTARSSPSPIGDHQRPQKIIEDVIEVGAHAAGLHCWVGGLLRWGSTSCPDCWAVVLVEGKW